jgi:hypothetical protein
LGAKNATAFQFFEFEEKHETSAAAVMQGEGAKNSGKSISVM